MNDLKWCLNDDPHSEHWAYNEFNGRNYCSGRPEGGSMSEYEVREAYAMTGEGLDFKRVAHERREEFDRWLRAVKAEAWDEGYGPDEECHTPRSNPYRKEQENN